MRNILYKSISVLAMVILFASCEKNPIEVANDEYDYSKIVPMILGKTGPTSMMRTYTGRFAVAVRGGSTYDWTVNGAELQEIEGVTYKVDVFFPTFNDHEPVEIVVKETTWAGLESDNDTFLVTVTPFIAPAIVGEEEIIIFSGEPNQATYEVAHRDGSTYAWTSSAGTIVATSKPWAVTLGVTQDNVGETITLTCNETHLGSENDVPSNIEIIINEFCPLPNEKIEDMVGSWSGDDAWYTSIITTAVIDATHLAVTGMNEGLIETWWNEEVIEGGTISMFVDVSTGKVDIPRQYIYTTDYDGDPFRYEIEGGGKWENCSGESPHLIITYDIYYEGETDGLAETYYPDYLPAPYFTADVTLDLPPKKSATLPVMMNTLLKPPVKNK